MKVILEAGTILHKRYEVLNISGQGDFGMVYQASDRQAEDGRQFVAIKQMPMQMIVNCERQADVRAMLIHPAIPAILGYFHQHDHAFLVQEFIQGANLEQILMDQPGFLPESIVISWAVQLCDVFAYLHYHPHHPLIFRDLKPNNVMEDEDGQVYLVDFGLARVFPPGYFQNRPPVFRHYRQGLAIGTQGYSPPEQYIGLLEPQSDLFALGATLHHLLTRLDPRREAPFTFQEHPVRSINPAVSEGLESIVMKALAPELEHRYASAQEMRTALEGLDG